MIFSWSFMLFCVSRHIYASSESHYYECGKHGKFEYCIDGIPGCVIGCHCHPGYYFDTDTKICEPSTKLTSFRRNYEPTRIPLNMDADLVPTLTTQNPLDSKVEAISKDTDDLGDWLYNQFFKTVENQVINSTDNNYQTPSRRSGSSPIKPKRRAHKKSKKSKKKHKKKNLKNKLLRITEDDSLFDSSSSSSSSDETTDDSSSSESDSDSSSDHDHRKIIMINKKPTPPLPSFIFLPNMETPFFPPIGLPAPPIMPMYPMVPVPPMGVMYQAETTACESTTTAKPKETTTAASSPDAGASDAAAETSDAPPNPDEPAPEAPSEGRSGLRTRLAHMLPGAANKNIHRNKLIQKVREKLKKRNKRPPVDVMENLQDLEAPFIEEPDKLFDMRPRPLSGLPRLEDVDFKYLSQLIHKIDLNKTMPKVQYPDPVLEYPNNAALPPLPQPPPPPLRRSLYQENIPGIFNQRLRPASKADEVNDTFYTDLGKQIASLIRQIDTKGPQQIDIEIQQQNPSNRMQTILNENRFAPRSYWERFIRSPLKYFKPFLVDHRKSNDKLINIEDQVNMATTLERTLSLSELENIANSLNTKKKTHRNTLTNKSEKVSKPNNVNLNINLLPHAIRQTELTNRNFIKDHNKNKANTILEKNKKSKNLYTAVRRRAYPIDYIRNNQTNSAQKNKTKPLREIVKINPMSNIIKTRHITSLYRQDNGAMHKNVTRNILPESIPEQQVLNYQVNPILLNYKSVNYLNNNRNKFQVQRTFVPFNVPFFSKQKTINNVRKPSYINREFHAFDYID